MDRSPVCLNRFACASRHGIGPVLIDVRRADGFAAKDAMNTGDAKDRREDVIRVVLLLRGGS